MLSEYVADAIARAYRAELFREAEKQRLLRQLPQQPSQRKIRFLTALQTVKTDQTDRLTNRQPAIPTFTPDMLCCEPAA